MQLTIVAGLDTHAGRGLYSGEGLINEPACMVPREDLRLALSRYSAGVGSRGGGGRGSMGGPCSHDWAGRLSLRSTSVWSKIKYLNNVLGLPYMYKVLRN